MELGPEELEEIRRYLRRVIAWICPRWMADQVEDLTNGAILRVLDVARRRESAEGFSRAYLGRVAHSHVIDEVRRRRRELCPEGYLDDDDQDPPSNGPDPEQGSRLRELGQAITGCLKKIGRHRRQAVVLMLMGHQNREVAAITGWSPKQAENYVTRGRENLRDCLRGMGYGR